MSDANLATGTLDHIPFTQQLSDSQVGQALAQKFLTDIRSAMSGPPNSSEVSNATVRAQSDLQSLVGDPLQSPVLNTIARKIQADDASLGPIFGDLEWNEHGQVTGFVFKNLKQNESYEASLTKSELHGKTLKQAIADDATNSSNQSSVRGIMAIQLDGTMEDNTRLIGAELPARTPAQPARDGSHGVLTIHG